jgi:hypothetical protein
LVCASFGCSSLLPSSDATDSPFRSFSGAFEAFSVIQPGETTVAELKALEIDPSRQGVTVRPFTSVAEVLLPHEGTPDELHPPAVAACIEARSRCQVWLLDVERLRRRRTGNWFVDASRFRRHREINGFLFSGVLLVLDDVAVYKLWAGIPRIDIQRTEVNPLGPFNDGSLPSLDYRIRIPGLSSSIRTAAQPRAERQKPETARDAQAVREAERARRRGHQRKGPGI